MSTILLSLIDMGIYASILIMLTIGFTLTYLVARIPNFAHGTFAVIGMYVTFTVVRIFHLNPYIALPTAFLIVGALEVLLYLTVISPLKKLGVGPIALTLSTIALQLILYGAINIYADYLQDAYHTYTRFFILAEADFRFLGLQGVFWVSLILGISTVALLHVFLTKTKFGISMRATVENPDLAEALGANVEFLSMFSWFLTGGIAGMAGALTPLWFQGHPNFGKYIIISIFAASMLGGISSIYGAILGGLIMGCIETLGITTLSLALGPWVPGYRLLITLSIFALVLIFMPRGITGFIEDVREGRIKLFKR